MLTSASGAATRGRKSLPVFENITARKTTGRRDVKIFTLGVHGTCYVRKMLIDFFFPNPYGLRDLSGTHLAFFQKLNHLFSCGLHGASGLRDDNSVSAFLKFYEFININIR